MVITGMVYYCYTNISPMTSPSISELVWSNLDSPHHKRNPMPGLPEQHRHLSIRAHQQLLGRADAKAAVKRHIAHAEALRDTPEFGMVWGVHQQSR